MSPDWPAPARPTRQVLAVLALIGTTGLGGNPGYFHDALVEKRGWLSNEEFLEGLMVCQAIPGPIFVSLMVFAGHRLGGWPAVLGGLAFSLVPGSIVVVLLSHVYALGVAQHPLVGALFQGLGASAAALGTITLLRIVRGTRWNAQTLVWAGLAFVALGPLHFSVLAVVPPLGLIGLWLNRPGARGRQ